MKRLAILLTLGILLSNLAGCALKPVEAPVTSSFSDLAEKLLSVNSKVPVTLPASPEAEPIAINGTEYLGFNKRNAKQLLIFRHAAEANTAIAIKQSLVINEQQLVQKNMVLAGKLMEQRANYLAFKWALSETELQEEQREHRIDNVLNRALIIVLALLLI